MALTGHSGSQAPQSMHSFGSMNSLRSVPSSKWMQSTGQTDTHDTSSTSMHGLAITHAIQDPPRVERLRESRRDAGSRAYHPPHSWGLRAGPADRDLHPACQVAGDVAADDPRRPGGA